MEQAIKKAIKSGYGRSRYVVNGDIAQWIHENHYSDVLLDKFFWECLGKAEGWSIKESGCLNNSCGYCEDYQQEIPEWLYWWKKFIQHLAEGKSVDSFFKELLHV